MHLHSICYLPEYHCDKIAWKIAESFETINKPYKIIKNISLRTIVLQTLSSHPAVVGRGFCAGEG